MDKLKMHSPDLTQRNIDAIAELFPTVVTETLDADGIPVRAIDFDALRQELSDHVVEGPQERYQLDWPGKRAAAFAANAPIAKTLRPMRDQSVNFDTTKNLFIDGDNLDALKLLQESYLGKIKLIYIDPPYNTGNDFVYDDDFAESSVEYLERSGQKSETGERLIANSESNGRFHSDWLSMMYPRLKLARNLLTDDGVIFISIDQHEHDNLFRMCAEVFGEKNVLGLVAVVNNLKGRSDDEHFATANEFLIACARNSDDATIYGFAAGEDYRAEFSLKDDISNYKEVGLQKTGKNSRRIDRPNMYYPIYFSPDMARFSLEKSDGALEIYPTPINGVDGCWRWGKETFLRNKDTELTARNVRGTWRVYVKMRDIVDGKPRTVRPKTVWIDPKYDTASGSRAVKELFDGNNYFDNPKPVEFIRDILTIGSRQDSIILDFFAGSGTTAQAVMAANASDGGSRRYIMVQVDEPVAASSDAETAGYKTISQISRERIQRAAARLTGSLDATGLDGGLRTFRIDSTNMKDSGTAADKLEQSSLMEAIDIVKPDRTDEDLLFQVLLDWGLDLAEPIGQDEAGTERVMSVADGALIACFADKVTVEIVKEIAKRRPLRAVFLDAGFESDAARINTEQIFRELSPETEVRTI